MIYVRDVAHVRDGYPPQTNIVRVDGRRGVLMTIQKTGSASTLDIIEASRRCCRRADSAAARSSTSTRSPISRSSCAAAIRGVVREA